MNPEKRTDSAFSSLGQGAAKSHLAAFFYTYFPLAVKWFRFVLDSGVKTGQSLQEIKRIRLLNGISLFSGSILAISITWLFFLGVPGQINVFFAPPIGGLLFLFIVSRYVSVTLAKYLLVILINITILLGGLVSDNTPRLQQVLNMWVFSSAGLWLIIFRPSEWLKILVGLFITFCFHCLIVPSDAWLDFGYSPDSIDNQTFVSISFIFSMSLLVSSFIYAQTIDVKIYEDLVTELQNNNERLSTQEEELRQSYGELALSREKLAESLKNESRQKADLITAMRIAKMGSYFLYAGSARCEWSDELKNLLEVSDVSATFFYDLIHEEDRDKVRRELESLDSKSIRTELTFRIYLPGGQIKVVNSAAEVAINETGEKAGIRGILHDITELKSIEARLVETNKELEEFIYRAYHDIKGPIATIKGISYAGRLAAAGSAADEYLGMIENNATRMEVILSKLVKVNEIKSMHVTRRPVLIGEPLQDAIRMLSGMSGFDEITITINDQTSVAFDTDPGLVKHIFLYLLENAVQYRSETEPHKTIQISISFTPGGDLQAIIEDNGIGIEPEYHQKIFDRNFRATQRSQGSGMGLFIASSLALKLNGNLTVQNSIPGKGSVFLFSLSAVQE